MIALTPLRILLDVLDAGLRRLDGARSGLAVAAAMLPVMAVLLFPAGFAENESQYLMLGLRRVAPGVVLDLGRRLRPQRRPDRLRTGDRRLRPLAGLRERADHAAGGDDGALRHLARLSVLGARPLGPRKRPRPRRLRPGRPRPDGRGVAVPRRRVRRPSPTPWSSSPSAWRSATARAGRSRPSSPPLTCISWSAASGSSP